MNAHITENVLLSENASLSVIQKMEVILDGTVDAREVLPQLDGAVILEWLAEQGYVITHQEKAA
ncbi:hypothetical protein [Klebsiella aerogenes]|uniref:hypothetical protein n=1 Tax=Klebsiella aerogenes TaxID=548 RepID=UPI0039840EAE